jgi:hypothetical protein
VGDGEELGRVVEKAPEGGAAADGGERRGGEFQRGKQGEGRSIDDGDGAGLGGEGEDPLAERVQGGGGGGEGEPGFDGKRPEIDGDEGGILTGGDKGESGIAGAGFAAGGEDGDGGEE